MNDKLTTMLREAAAHETLPLAPAAQVRRRAEQLRRRRRAGAAAVVIAVVVGGGLVARGALSSGPFRTDVQPAPAPTAGPTPPTDGPPPSPYPTAPVTSEATGEPTGGPTSTSWPAPPASHVAEPWIRPGFDAGDIVAVRLVDGRAMITVDRFQLYSREQWREKTGETIDHDFRRVNESTRTREFVIDDDALIYVNWQYGEQHARGSVQITLREFVERTQQALRDVDAIGVMLFHRDGPDGPVAYLEDLAQYTG